MNEFFDWDEANIRHIARHNIMPEEVEEVITNDPLEVAEELIDDEIRITQIGETNAFRYLAVVTTWRGTKLRVVTAFDATPFMHRMYLKRRSKL